MKKPGECICRDARQGSVKKSDDMGKIRLGLFQKPAERIGDEEQKQRERLEAEQDDVHASRAEGLDDDAAHKARRDRRHKGERDGKRLRARHGLVRRDAVDVVDLAQKMRAVRRAHEHHRKRDRRGALGEQEHKLRC